MDFKRIFDDIPLQTAKQVEILDALKVKHDEIGQYVQASLESCSEKLLAAQKIEEARFWLTMAVANHPEHYPDA